MDGLTFSCFFHFIFLFDLEVWSCYDLLQIMVKHSFWILDVRGPHEYKTIVCKTKLAALVKSLELIQQDIQKNVFEIVAGKGKIKSCSYDSKLLKKITKLVQSNQLEKAVEHWNDLCSLTFIIKEQVQEVEQNETLAWVVNP